MVSLTLNPHPVLLLTVLLHMGMNISAFPHPFQRISPSDAQDSTQDQWKVLYPSISLHDWSVQMMSSPDFDGSESRTEELPVNEWIPLSQSRMEDKLVKGWPEGWQQRVGNQGKRNIVVADDAAFREKSKLLTAMERQKWLNSYMQKLLVVN